MVQVLIVETSTARGEQASSIRKAGKKEKRVDTAFAGTTLGGTPRGGDNGSEESGDVDEERGIEVGVRIEQRVD